MPITFYLEKRDRGQGNERLGKYVEMAFFFWNKNQVSGLLPKQWVFGGICKDTNKICCISSE